MTIEEAIAQLKDLRKDRESFAKSDEPGEVFEQDIEAIDVALEHMDKHGTYISMNAHRKLMKENADLKRLLRLAVEEITKQKLYADIGMLSRSALCKSCKTRSITNRFCQVCNYEYEHAEEAMKLLGDEDNEQ